MRRRFTPDQAVVMLRAAGAEPLEPYPENMTKPWRCRCLSCGADIFPRMQALAKAKHACRYCHGPTPVNPDFAIDEMRRAGVEPLEPYPGYDKPWSVRCCTCGRESTPMYRSIAKGQGACFRCGTNYKELPARVYLVHDEKRRVVKVGITNARAHRMTKYANWTLVALVETSTGEEAAQIEAEVLRHWAVELKLRPKLTRGEMPDKGYTETADDIGLEPALAILRKYSAC